MAVCANVPADILNKPRTVRNTSTVVQSTPTFTMYGAPLPAQISPLTGLTEKVRKGGVTKDTSNWTTYFAADNYSDTPLKTSNILGSDSNSTLRFKDETYALLFACLHYEIWDRRGFALSLVFRADSKNFYHIWIPVTFNGASPATIENPFLRSWITASPVTPAGLSLNDVLNFRGHENAVDFSLMEFCLNYNRGSTDTSTRITSVYNFCYFDTPLYISRATYNNANLLFKESVSKHSYDQIFNLILRSEIFLYVSADVRDPYLLSQESHFGDAVVTQNSIIPAFFTVPTHLLSGSPYTSDQLKENVRGLKNIKCYPIDLASQVDDNGNIYIEKSTNKPTDTRDILKDFKASPPPPLSKNPFSSETSTKTRNMVVLVLIKILVGLILLYIVIYIITSILKPTKVETISIQSPPPAASRPPINPLAVAAAATVAIASSQS